MSTQTEQQLEDITALLTQPTVTEGEEPEFAIDLSQVVAEQNATNPELNTIANLDQLTLTPETIPANVVNLEPEVLNSTVAAAEKVTKKAQKEAEKAEKAAAKAAEKAKKDSEKAAKEAEKAAKAEAKIAKKEPAPKQPTQNGVRKPKDTTECGKVWLLCAAISESLGRMLTCKELVADERSTAINIRTVTSEYYMWKRFYFGATTKSETPAV